MNIQKKYRFLFILWGLTFVVVTILNSCNKGCRNSYECNQTFIDSLYIQDSTREGFPYKEGDTIVYRTSAGDTLLYAILKIGGSYMPVYINIEWQECKRKDINLECFDYYKSEQFGTSLVPDSGSEKIGISVRKSLPYLTSFRGSDVPPFNAEGGFPDQILFIINDNYFKLDIRYPDYYIFHSSYKLDGIEYTNVYELSFYDFYFNLTDIQLYDKLFYSMDKGILALYSLNGDKMYLVE